jgi:iron complex outermembrane receptor protein
MKIINRSKTTERREASHLLFTAVTATLLADTALPQDSVPPSTDNDGARLEEIIVSSRGETRQIQTVTAEQIAQLPPGTSPLKAIENLPGVNFQAADPYGSYEWSTRISVRGFNQNRLGFTLDGVPLGDMTYGNHNGLHVSRAIPTELVREVRLSQGTGSLDTASANNLGGTIQFFSADPREEFGISAEQGFGSDSTRRTFVNVDSGVLGSATRLQLSLVDGSTAKWKGAGDQQIEMINAKLVQGIGEGRLTLFYNTSDRAEIDYQDLSKDIVNRRGEEWDNWYPDWNSAVNAANVCAASGGNDAVACDDAYWNASGLRKDDLGYLAFDLPIGDRLNFKATAYKHTDEGQGLWGTPYVPTPGGAPLSIRTTEYDLDRTGVVTALAWAGDSHEIEGGLWYETNDFNQARRFYGEPSVAAPTRNFEDMQTNPFQTDWEYDFDTETIVFHVQDTWSASDAVRIDFGFRSVNVENSALTIVGPVKTGTIEADEPFLPQVGINWTLSGGKELFASAAENVRAFASSGTSGPFSTTAAGFAAIAATLEPETSTNYEAGVRFIGESLDALFAVYHVDFENRLLGIPRGPGIVGNPSVLANVGSVSTNGVEAAFSWRPMTNFSWFTSAAWNDSEYADDYAVTDGAGVSTIVPVAGKQVTDAPELLIKSEFTYNDGSFFARLGVNFTDERYYTYLNQGSVDSYTLVNLGIGYRFQMGQAIEEFVIQADATNLTDEYYFSTIDSNGFVVSDPNGTAQTLLAGAPRQYFVSLKARF